MRSRLGASPMSLASPGRLRNLFSCLAEPHAAASMSWRCVDAASRTYLMRNASPSLFLCLCDTVYTQIQTDMYVHQHMHYRRALRKTAQVMYRSWRRRSRIAHTHTTQAGRHARTYTVCMHVRVIRVDTQTNTSTDMYTHTNKLHIQKHASLPCLHACTDRRTCRESVYATKASSRMRACASSRACILYGSVNYIH